MIKLYIFPAAFELRNVSPFCMKTEMTLKYLKLDYEIVELGDPRKSPLGKLPYIEDKSTEEKGEIISDSEIINEYLDKKTDGGLYKDLSDIELAQGIAFTRLVEDHLYWMLVASRWLDEQWFPNIREGFFGGLPGPMKYLVGKLARGQVKKTYELQGLGKHDLKRQKAFARRDLQAIANVVAGEGYIVGKRLTVFDFTVTSLIAGALDQKPGTWINPIIDEFPTLKIYAQRVQSEVGVYGGLSD